MGYGGAAGLDGAPFVVMQLPPSVVRAARLRRFSHVTQPGTTATTRAAPLAGRRLWEPEHVLYWG